MGPRFPSFRQTISEGGVTCADRQRNRPISAEFLTPDEIERFGKELDEYRSEIFRKEYLPRVRPFPKVRELFRRIRDDGKRIVLASSGKEEDTKYYIEKLLKSTS